MFPQVYKKLILGVVVLLFNVLPIYASEITFSVTVPEETAPTDTVYIWGSTPELGNWVINAVPLAQNPDGIWAIQVDLTAGETVFYQYSKGSLLTVERGPIGEWVRLRMLLVSDSASVVQDTVLKWGRFGPYLSWVNDPRTTMTISWRTAREGDGLVEFGPDSSYGSTGVDSAIGELHSVELTGLEPSTEYHYRVLSSSGEIGVNHTFSTANFPDEPFSFVAYGDTRTNDDDRALVVSRILQVNPDLVFNTGDLVEDGNYESQWRLWFSTNQMLLEDKPYFVAIGNHEHNAPIYYDYWHFPGNEQWYSVNYGNAHFICLSTETYLYGDQRSWLESDLAAASDSALWIFVFFHKPPYSSGSHGSSNAVRNAWCSLFETYGVDIVFNGHDHHYERSLVNGVYYIVTGGGGAPLRPVGASSWTIYSESTLHCCGVTIEDSLLTLDAIKPDGTIFDSFSINKGGVKVADKGNIGLEGTFLLYQNYPNPFNEATEISFRTPTSGHLSLKIYDVRGQEIRTLMDQQQNSGYHSFPWNGRNNEGKVIASGIYFYRLEVTDKSQRQWEQTRKMILLR